MENEGIRLHKRKWNWLDRGEKKTQNDDEVKTQNELRSHEEPQTIGSIFRIENVDRYSLGPTKPTKQNKTKKQKNGHSYRDLTMWTIQGLKRTRDEMTIRDNMTMPSRKRSQNQDSGSCKPDDHTIGPDHRKQLLSWNKQTNTDTISLKPKQNLHGWINTQTRIFTRIPQKTKGMIRKQEKPEGEEVDE